MTGVLIVLALITCVILTLFILVQKPKGGGLSGSFGSAGTQVMGVQKSGDVMEKGTWLTMTLIALFSIASTFTLGINVNKKAQDAAQKQEQQAQQQGGAAQGTTPAPAK